MTCTFLNDPGPGGLTGVMNFDMLGPPAVVGGDVVLLNTDTSLSDLIRFDSNSKSFFFYSDLDGGVDQPADLGLPTAFNNNVVRLSEVSLGGGLTGLNYTPSADQPGFVPGFAVSYTFISDSPEPATWMLALAGASLVAIRRLRISRS
jgi:hypothetical protein